jgi:hypothetical protein
MGFEMQFHTNIIKYSCHKAKSLPTYLKTNYVLRLAHRVWHIKIKTHPSARPAAPNQCRDHARNFWTILLWTKVKNIAATMEV